MKKQEYPRSFSHIGIIVPDNINKAVEFYEKVMGWYVIMSPSTVKEEDDTAIGKMCIDVFRRNWKEFEIAHLSISDGGIGIEMFSFKNMDDVKPEFTPFNTGLFHFWLQDADIESLVDKIVAYATAIVRLIQTNFNVQLGRTTAGRRSEYVPKATNETS